jgi:hypothetical protein
MITANTMHLLRVLLLGLEDGVESSILSWHQKPFYPNADGFRCFRIAGQLPPYFPWAEIEHGRYWNLLVTLSRIINGDHLGRTYSVPWGNSPFSKIFWDILGGRAPVGLLLNSTSLAHKRMGQTLIDYLEYPNDWTQDFEMAPRLELALEHLQPKRKENSRTEKVYKTLQLLRASGVWLSDEKHNRIQNILFSLAATPEVLNVLDVEVGLSKFFPKTSFNLLPFLRQAVEWKGLFLRGEVALLTTLLADPADLPLLSATMIDPFERGLLEQRLTQE